MRPEVFVWGCVFPCRDVVYLAFYSTYGTSNPPTGDIQEQAANRQRTGNEQGRPSQICHGQGDFALEAIARPKTCLDPQSSPWFLSIL